MTTQEEWHSLRELDVQPGDTVRHRYLGERVIDDTSGPKLCRDAGGEEWYWDRPVWQLVSRTKDQPTDWAKVKPGTPVEVSINGGWEGDYTFVCYYKAPEEDCGWVAVAHGAAAPWGRRPAHVRLVPPRETRSVFYYATDDSLAPTKLGTIELENGKPVRDSFKLEGEE